jgi:hypothetical protein
MCIDRSITDGCDKKKGGNEKGVCQYDYCDKTAFNELCGFAGIY